MATLHRIEIINPSHLSIKSGHYESTENEGIHEAGPRNSEDIEIEFPDGRWIRIRERVSPSGFSVGVRTDITSLKVRESELKEAREGLLARASELSGLVKAAQESDSAKSAFVASVSHELRTPLNAIVGYSFLLRETNLNSEQLGYMDAMASATRHLSRMVNDILDLSGLERLVAVSCG